MRTLINDRKLIRAGEGQKLREDWRRYQNARSTFSELLDKIGYPILSASNGRARRRVNGRIGLGVQQQRQDGIVEGDDHCYASDGS